jgi:anthranilate phosphoribosyltransferase
MNNLRELTRIVANGTNLKWEESASAAHLLAAPDVSLSDKQNFLIALTEKGETSVEVGAFAAVFRELAIDPGVDAWAPRAIDVCGTGGDGAHTFNISTAVSFIVAAAGVPVFKHGNRSITSKCGSADLMEALGFRLEAPHDQLRESLEVLNFCFFFAPAFHPAFKEIMPVRKALAESGRRSVFNLLGPLINPGRPAFQLMGVFSEHWVQPIGEALGSVGLDGGLVAHCAPGPGLNLDELSCVGKNTIAGFGRLESQRGVLSPEDYGLGSCDLDSLKGGDVDENLTLLHDLLEGSLDSEREGLRDSVLFNAGVALWIAGQVKDIESGVAQAREIIQTGQAKAWLLKAQAFYGKK